jgi:predicted nucleic acid-binding protein
VLIDTNVFLDVLLRREKLVEGSAKALSHMENRAQSGIVCSISITTMHYMLKRSKGEEAAREDIHAVLQSMELASVSRTTLDAAINSAMTDFEDAVIAHAAQQAGAQAIITRNLKDFTRSPVPAYTPEQWLMMPG